MTDRYFTGPVSDDGQPPKAADLVEITDHIEPRPELLNASRDAAVVAACTEGGVDHDYRPITDWAAYGTPTYLHCVWCHAVACGSHADPDPCIEPWHHEPRPHRTKAGVTWPIGGTRPEQVTR